MKGLWLFALAMVLPSPPANAVECSRIQAQFNFKAEDLRTYILQTDAVITMIQSTNSPPQRLTIDWLIPFAMSIEAAKSLVAIYRVSPECFNLSTKEIENGIAERERVLNVVANIVRGQMRGLKPP